ncbi:MAG: hypothetical protein H5U40_16715, partial [Polyangiaceae bacterium]|nr:hypothetical protein [Polyangiaceae bacterium]
LSLPRGTRISVLAPVQNGGSEDDEAALLAKLKKDGFVRVRVNGVVRELADLDRLPSKGPREVEVVVDRLTVDERSRSRLGEALELSMSLAGGRATVLPEGGAPLAFSESFVVPGYDGTFPALTPALFSFNGRVGACKTCEGLGDVRAFAADLVIGDSAQSLREGAILPWGKPGGALHSRMIEAARASGLPLDAAISTWSEADRLRLLEGDAGRTTARSKKRTVAPFEGVLPSLARRLREHERRRRESGADEERTFAFLEEELGAYMRRSVCPTCDGERLALEARLVRVGGKNLPELCALTLDEARAFLAELVVPPAREKLARRVLVELDRRLAFL